MTDSKIINDIIILVSRETGIDITRRDEVSLLKRINERMKKNNLSEMRDYYEQIITDKNELKSFIELIVVNETKFMRDRNHFRFLGEEYFPQLIKTVNSSIFKKIHILSLGCSTGQESYSSLMTLLELEPPENIEIRVTGVDISERVIKKAEKGVYSDIEMRGLNEPLKNKYFNYSNNKYEIKNNVKKFINFNRMNINNEVEFTNFKRKFNVIFVKNVLFYFKEQQIRKILTEVKKILHKDGILFLSPSETNMTIMNDFFEEFYYRNAIIYKNK